MKNGEELSAKIDRMLDLQATLIDRVDALILELRQNAYPKGAVSEDFDDELEHVAEEVRREML